MTQLKSSLKKLVTARWFPTVTKPILTGVVGSGAVVALHYLFHVNVLPGQAEAAAGPLVGFLLTSITQRTHQSTSVGETHVTVVAHTLPGRPSVGKTIATSLTEQLAEIIDADPTLVQSLASKALERVLAPAQEIKPASDGILAEAAWAMKTAAPAVVESALTRTVMPTSADAPHITQ